MSKQMNRVKIADGVYFNAITDPKFKSNRISVNLLVPLDEEIVSQLAVVPFVLRLRYQDQPDFTKLNEKLCELYGASVDGDVRKYGKNQMINLSVQTLDDRYTIEGEPLTKECAELLCGMLFDPYLENGFFAADDVLLEKQNLIDTIESEINDKRGYAIGKCGSLMYEGTPFAIKKYGTRELAEKITPQNATEAYHFLLEKAAVEILFIGSGDPTQAQEIFAKRFASAKRSPAAYDTVLPAQDAKTYKEQTETMDLSQGKLVMGFRTGKVQTPDEVNEMKMMVALFGGTPFSRLFKNVREKLQLCYYCAAHYDKAAGLMMVDSGIETGNENKAKEEILHQLELVKNGEFEQEELDSTILMLENALKTTGDTLSGLENWYLTQILSGTNESPLENAEKIAQITKENIQNAARKITLDTVYFLAGKKGEA